MKPQNRPILCVTWPPHFLTLLLLQTDTPRKQCGVRPRPQEILTLDGPGCKPCLLFNSYLFWGHYLTTEWASSLVKWGSVPLRRDMLSKLKKIMKVQHPSQGCWVHCPSVGLLPQKASLSPQFLMLSKTFLMLNPCPQCPQKQINSSDQPG